MPDQGCTCTIDSRTGHIHNRENGCPIHGAAVTDLIVAAWAERGWSPAMLPQHILDMVLVAVDAARAPLLDQIAAARARIVCWAADRWGGEPDAG
jgi:hypothetical protein